MNLPRWPTVMVALMLPALVALGVWQLQRREEKAVLIAQLNAATAAARARPPVRIGAQAPEPRGVNFARAIVACDLTAAPVAVQAGRSLRGRTGYSYKAFCPVAGVAGGRVRLDIGWDPRPDRLAKVTARGPFAGILRELMLENYAPTTAHRFELVSARAVPPLEPSAPPSLETIPDNHLTYAVTWFAFAVTLAVIYTLYARKWRRERGPV